ncbi:sensor histidine kinase [Asanoa sp. WMMD1127]|uniref:sensor histidine kinase n=1 Tax=Asanoa sp. WMMD1127 TaxID=3016107 RepID=UPI002416AF0E|nr:sensor histidine kinase [Asanoa sp. WMMD1127]MDG4825778.1 sensor histidine kinase [Asanoa sp. WMMD1127]
MTVEREPTLDWLARHPGPWFGLIWAPVLLIAPLVDAITGGQPGRAGYLVALAVAFTLAVLRRGTWAFVGFTALCTGYLVLWHTDRQFVFPLLSIAAALAVRQRWALGLVTSVTISGAVAAGIEARSLDTGLFLGFATLVAGVATFLIRYLVGVVAELTETRERLAVAAVAAERLRFSRDLHDLLGHTLSVIVVKAQAVHRLFDRDPPAAAEHARDIEAIGRQALTEVRETVSGYRAMSLGEELANARTALAAGNVRAEVSPAPATLAGQVDALLGWVVREGITNVLRHAQARTCRIAVSVDDEVARVEITDDGHGDPGGAPGSGLRGLRERLEAAGGALTTTSTAGGFTLSARVPAA